ncbi:hypothetical protein, partial [Thiocystis violacea]|uniref:hypothetical protein n=1 Tax=Thiocystis violacea TaxID=13725 RepID=UPI001907DD6A
MATTYAEILDLLGELIASQKETDRRFQETDRKFQETGRLLREQSQETDRKFQETDRKFQETDRKFQETDRKFQETDRKFQETSRLVGDLGGQWGLFVENQVAPACERLFTERGIPVQMVSQRVKKRLGGEVLEVDVMVVNCGHLVAVEVKASLSAEDVRTFLEDLRRFREFFPEYADCQVHGAVAGIRIEDGA